MESAARISRWQEGQVDRTKEHFELRYGSANSSDWKKWQLVALIGPPKGGVVDVHFLIAPNNQKNVKRLDEVKRDIEFFFFELKELDPWGYAQYHCTTGANLYGNVHWSFFKCLDHHQ